MYEYINKIGDWKILFKLLFQSIFYIFFFLVFLFSSYFIRLLFGFSPCFRVESFPLYDTSGTYLSDPNDRFFQLSALTQTEFGAAPKERRRKWNSTEGSRNLREIIGSITGLMRDEIITAELSVAYIRGAATVSIFQRPFQQSRKFPSLHLSAGATRVRRPFRPFTFPVFRSFAFYPREIDSAGDGGGGSDAGRDSRRVTARNSRF